VSLFILFLIVCVLQNRIYSGDVYSKVRHMKHTVVLFAMLIFFIGCGKEKGLGQLFDTNNAGHVKMEAVFRKKVSKKTGDFTEDDLRKIIALSLTDNQIDDLSPLEGLGQLQVMELGKNQITDLAPLSGLTNLVSLNLSDNQITDLAPLQKLGSLKNLDLSNNQITDLMPLQTPSLEGLRELDLSNNPGLTKVEIDRYTKAMPFLSFQRHIKIIHNAK
jgi:hypothetical protein